VLKFDNAQASALRRLGLCAAHQRRTNSHSCGFPEGLQPVSKKGRSAGRLARRALAGRAVRGAVTQFPLTPL